MFRKLISFCTILCMLMLFSACGAEQDKSMPFMNDDIVENVASEQSEDAPNTEPTIAQQIYENMLSASDYLSLTSDGYKLNDYPISKDSVTKIDDQLVVNQGAIYEEIGAGLSLYCEFGLTQTLDAQFFQVLTSSEKEPDNWSELANELYEFICPDGTEKEILSKLETMIGVSGTFDYENRNYEFTVENLETLADDLQISDEMMGYVLAKLSEYPSEFMFDGETLKVNLEVKTFS